MSCRALPAAMNLPHLPPGDCCRASQEWWSNVSCSQVAVEASTAALAGHPGWVARRHQKDPAHMLCCHEGASRVQLYQCLTSTPPLHLCPVSTRLWAMQHLAAPARPLTGASSVRCTLRHACTQSAQTCAATLQGCHSLRACRAAWALCHRVTPLTMPQACPCRTVHRAALALCRRVTPLVNPTCRPTSACVYQG